MGGVSHTEFCYYLLDPWTPDLSAWLNQVRQFSLCGLLLSLLVLSWEHGLDLKQGYWEPRSSTQLVPPEFLGVKTMVIYPFGKLRALALAFSFLVLPSAPPW